MCLCVCVCARAMPSIVGPFPMMNSGQLKALLQRHSHHSRFPPEASGMPSADGSFSPDRTCSSPLMAVSRTASSCSRLKGSLSRAIVAMAAPGSKDLSNTSSGEQQLLTLMPHIDCVSNSISCLKSMLPLYAQNTATRCIAMLRILISICVRLMCCLCHTSALQQKEVQAICIQAQGQCSNK